MIIRKRFTLISLCTFCLSLCLSAQETDRISYPNFKVDGTLKNKFEYAPETRISRFLVRNSRIGVSGNINSFSSYRVQVELSNEGKFSVLDLSGTLKLLEGLFLTLGQTGIPLFNSYITTPGEMMFANRTFLGKYYLGSKDLGVSAKYNFHLGALPAKLELGLFNGNTINNPVWKEEMAYGGRVELGRMQGARVTAKMYNYPNSDSTHFLFYGADFRYEKERWKVETEIMERKSKTEYHNDMLSYYAQGAYLFPVKTKMFEFVKPAIRWDAIDKRMEESGFDVNRLTVEVGFGFNSKQYLSILRLDYEWYFVNNSMTIFAKNKEMDLNRITMELLFTF